MNTNVSVFFPYYRVEVLVLVDIYVWIQFDFCNILTVTLHGTMGLKKKNVFILLP